MKQLISTRRVSVTATGRPQLDIKAGRDPCWQSTGKVFLKGKESTLKDRGLVTRSRKGVTKSPGTLGWKEQRPAMGDAEADGLKPTRVSAQLHKLHTGYPRHFLRLCPPCFYCLFQLSSTSHNSTKEQSRAEAMIRLTARARVTQAELKCLECRKIHSLPRQQGRVQFQEALPKLQLSAVNPAAPISRDGIQPGTAGGLEPQAGTGLTLHNAGTPLARHRGL